MLLTLAYKNRLKEPLLNRENWFFFSRPDNRCLMGNVSDLHFGSRAKRGEKKNTVNARIRVFLLLQINYTMGVVSFAQNVLSHLLRSHRWSWL